MVSVIASESAPASPKGTDTNPGVNGPKPERVPGSLEKPAMVVVRPWKLPVQTMIDAWSSGTPLTVYPHRRTTLIAVSTASAPVFMGTTISMPQSAARSRQKGSRLSVPYARPARVSRVSCRRAVATRRG